MLACTADPARRRSVAARARARAAAATASAASASASASAAASSRSRSEISPVSGGEGCVPDVTARSVRRAGGWQTCENNTSTH
ncbi:hypothetical protein C8259_19660 [Nocardia nova]|uniref:Secreted protein n=1 Tax=Nocardia nova TaxID=37330 RepID=A0A2T2Z0M3_9NOCA|nr:hypothetical protein C8259_19660 [Nocardia nova]